MLFGQRNICMNRRQNYGIYPTQSTLKKGCKTKSPGETKRMPWGYFYW